MEDIRPNALPGLASGLDTKGIIEKLINVQKKQIQPIIERKEEKLLEIDAWKQVKSQLETIRKSAGEISKKSIWEGKIVTSSDPEIVEATATDGANPGKYTLTVDKIALNHQIVSQNFESKDSKVGQGNIYIKIGEGEEENIFIDEANSTLAGVSGAINSADIGPTASIIKTGNAKKPYQLVLTSDNTGKAGAISIRTEMEGGEAPSFESSYTQPSKWKGVPKEERKASKPDGGGASTAIPESEGTYTGKEPIEIKFTAVNSGTVGISENLQIKWEDNFERYGYLRLGSFDYTPGEPIDVVDGIKIIFSDGDLLVNDSFTLEAKNQDSDLKWWVPTEDRPAKIFEPSAWKRQSTEAGSPIITGSYTGEDDDEYLLMVKGGGVVGEAQDLRIEYTSEEGKRGEIFIGAGYEPGSVLSLGDGIEVKIKSGILNDGDTATFEAIAPLSDTIWWLDETIESSGSIEDIEGWFSKKVDEDEEQVRKIAAKRRKGRRSTAPKEITGIYTGSDSKTYEFKVKGNGSVGVSATGLELSWKDNKGNSGIIDVGESYVAGTPILFDEGLSLSLDPGQVYDQDSFSFKTFSSVIQPAQDAEIRLGATEYGGGLLVTNSKNLLEDVIEGVKLNLLQTSKKIITINIRGDTEKATEAVKKFVEDYNQFLVFVRDSTKYDQDSGETGILQGDRNLPRIQQSMNNLIVDTVQGLESDRNMLLTIGIKLTNEGILELDEEKFKQEIELDFTKAANLFCSMGISDKSGVSYLFSGKNTEVSGSNGFDVDITQTATNGYYESPILTEEVKYNKDNNRMIVSLNGRDSGEIEFEPGNYSLNQIVSNIEKKLREDDKVRKMKFIVTAEGGRLRIKSLSYGQRSEGLIRQAPGSVSDGNNILLGNSVKGLNVEGLIDGIQMKGQGQILSGEEGTKIEGLKLFVELSKNQIAAGSEVNLVVTKGVATKIGEYIESVLEERKGALDIYTKNVEEQYQNYEDQVNRLEERLVTKREKLNTKFANLEAKMGQLKSEQSYLTSQFSSLGVR